MSVPGIQNVTLGTSNNQGQATIPKGTSLITLQYRTAAALRFAFTPGVVNGSSPTGPYATVNSGVGFTFPCAPPSQGSDADTVLYFASSVGNGVVEIITV